nr:multiple epidermal growth factor-like domains protein 11 [Crassostrea gigas]
MPSLSLAVSVILLVLMTKVCIIRGSCSNRQTSDCCSTGYFYDSVSRKCMVCPDGFTGVNCSIKCRFPSYGYRCQSACNCSEENCEASTGCILNTQRIPKKNDALSTTGGSLVYASDQETGSVSGSKQINLETKISPDVVATPVLVTTVVVLLVVLVAIVSRYTWRKYVARRENGREQRRKPCKRL